MIAYCSYLNSTATEQEMLCSEEKEKEKEQMMQIDRDQFFWIIYGQLRSHWLHFLRLSFVFVFVPNVVTKAISFFI